MSRVSTIARTMAQKKTHHDSATTGCGPAPPGSALSAAGTVAPGAAQTGRRNRWLEYYLARLEGKQAREKYYALLERSHGLWSGVPGAKWRRRVR